MDATVAYMYLLYDINTVFKSFTVLSIFVLLKRKYFPLINQYTVVQSGKNMLFSEA